MTYSRKIAAALAASVCVVAIATPACAQVREYKIPAGSLKSALDAYARQSGRQVIYKIDEVRGARSGGARGAMSADGALDALLAGSGFVARKDASGAIAIVRGQVLVSGEDQAGSAAAQNESADSDDRGKSEILVVGSKSQNVDIRRTEDDPQPYVVYDQEDIERSGATSVEDFFRRRLPMNTQGQVNNQGAAGTASNISQINLRGLGVQQTLILIDGRRAPRAQSVTSFSSLDQADVNGIPLGSIERIEVLPSSAGGIYGGGAVGGVINIIRKRNYNGLDARIGYDGTFRGGGETFRAELSGGFSLNGGTTQISFSASRASSRPLHVGDNDLWSRARERSIAVGYDKGPFLGATANIAATATLDLPCFFATSDFNACRKFITNLTLKPAYGGASLGSPFTSVPVGYGGVASDNGAALVANAGKYNRDLPNSPSGGLATLLNNPRISSANINIRQTVTPDVEVYSDFSWTQNLGRNNTPVALGLGFFLPASAPNNPFQQDITLSFPDGTIRSSEFTSETVAASGGVIVRLGGGWTATASYDWSKARIMSILSGDRIDVEPTSALRTAYQQNAQFNPIRDLDLSPFDYSQYIFDVPDGVAGPFVTYQRVLSARVSGKLLTLPGGPLNVTFLAERRNESAATIRSFDYAVPAGTLLGSVTPRRSQSVDSVYAEFNAPLIGAENGVPLFYGLDATFAVRGDRYSTRTASVQSYLITTLGDPGPSYTYSTDQVSAVSFTGAFAWAPVNGIKLRGSYATGFLPPNINQLTPRTTVEAGPIDPKRGNTRQLSGVTTIRSGNPDLSPETSRTLSLGGILSPGFLPGFRASVDYTVIRKTNEISSVNTTVAFLEQYFPERVVRQPLSAADQALGYTGGPIATYNVGLVNVGKTRIRAWDFQLDYSFNTRHLGDWSIYAVGTYQQELRRQLLPTTSPYNTAGFSDGPLKWRGNVGVDWTIGNLNLGWNGQFYDRYSIMFGAFAPNASPNPAAVAQQGAVMVPNQFYNDVYVRYHFPKGGTFPLSGVVLTLTVQNVLDERPPIIVPLSTGGINYSPYGDPRLRRFSVQLQKTF